MNPFRSRFEAVRAGARREDIDVVMASIGPELPYLTGYEAMDTERLTMLVLGQGDLAALVVPQLEAPRIAERYGLFDVVAWGETEDPIEIVAALAGGAQTVAIGDRTRSRFLLDLQSRLSKTRFVSSAPVLDSLRIRKDAWEVEALRTVAAAADRGSARLAELEWEGRSELEVAADLASLLREEGHETVAFTIVASGPNGASPHHEPGTRRIMAGDPIVVDFGGRIGGYFSDTTRNVLVGSPPEGYREVFETVRSAHAAAAATAQPGVTAQAVDRAARAVIVEAGYGGFFVHRTGHGIGLEGHESPYVVEGNETVMEPGMAFSIEPGIYLPGRFGVRIEDIAVITDDDVELLNQASHDLVVV